MPKQGQPPLSTPRHCHTDAEKAAWHALDHIRRDVDLNTLPIEARRALVRALTLLEQGEAKTEELRSFLGSNWVIARRTSRIVAKYGPDVNCICAAKLRDAERRAIEARVDSILQS